ncbi:hypothetical protein BC936DRAFT_146161 [Jimgerdemannia flammicorona]|uniref:Uncharacterized protein n=1 Tax=Jimgerdemannia flammicorona TaxID=994334 RepID=A0A433D8Z0_9FUNG|nr:hypothetical protein BC936DRAFT_146161 [Jimgerdemannia flammicorona]
MHPFIPYVPKTAEGVTETDWQLALSTWNSSLSNLLRATDESFLKQITTDTSLHHFFETFLRYHASGTADVATGSTAEIQLVKSVLVTFLRLSELSSTDAPITSPPNLINLATVYGKSNVQTTRTVFGNLNVRLPQLVAQFVPLVPATLDCLHRIQQLYVKDSTIKSANGATPDTKAHDVVQNIDILLGVAFTLDSLFAVSFPIAHIFYDHTDFLPTIIDLYDTTLPGIYDVLGAEKGGGSLTHRSKIGGVKVALVSMMNHLLDARGGALGRERGFTRNRRRAVQRYDDVVVRSVQLRGGESLRHGAAGDGSGGRV